MYIIETWLICMVFTYCLETITTQCTVVLCICPLMSRPEEAVLKVTAEYRTKINTTWCKVMLLIVPMDSCLHCNKCDSDAETLVNHPELLQKQCSKSSRQISPGAAPLNWCWSFINCQHKISTTFRWTARSEVAEATGKQWAFWAMMQSILLPV